MNKSVEAVGEQLALLEVMRRESQPVSDEVIRMQPDLLSAIKLSIQVSGLEPKQLYMGLGIDKATWSKILDGQLNFPTNRYEDFMDLVGNEIVLAWLAHRRGKGLIELRDAKDRRIATLERQLAERDAELNTLEKFGLIKRAKE